MVKLIWNVLHIVYITIYLILSCTDQIYALKCWHCVADDCHNDPDGNYKAVKKDCLTGQFCQKVYFEMYSTTDHLKYHSTVRGCAWNCQDQNDFRNCTSDLYSSRGCIHKSCCIDKDLCNKSPTNHIINYSLIVTALFSVYLIKCAVAGPVPSTS